MTQSVVLTGAVRDRTDVYAEQRGLEQVLRVVKAADVEVPDLQTILGERFAPTTSSGGFICAPLDEVTDALQIWRETLYGPGVRTSTSGGPAEPLLRLQPLRMGSRPREALLSMGPWTAYFDNGLRGTDPIGAMSVLSQRLLCQAIAVTSIPHTSVPGKRGGRMGAVQFTLFGPVRTDYINYVRTVEVVFDGDRWVFNASGTVQAFEEVETYSARKVRDRFTSEMLARYCRALGVDPFNPDSFESAGTVLESNIPMKPDMLTMTLIDAQKWLGIEPGQADQLAG